MTDRLADTISLLERLIAYPTVSADSNLDLIDDLAGRLEKCGARIDLFHDDSGQKATLFATIGPDRPGGIVLSGHTDVVPVTDQDWSSDPFAMRLEDDRAYGRGSCDMKGFIAATVAMASDLTDRDLHRPVHFSFTYDEEVGCLGAQALVPELQKRDIRPAMAIIGEPTEMKVIEGHKGCSEYTTRFTGLEGHGSMPDRGVNAVEFAVHFVSKLMALREGLIRRAPLESRFDPPWSTINIGAVRGGSAHNVIPGKAEVEWEMRPVQQSDADLVKERLARHIEDVLLPAMRKISPQADINTETIAEVCGLEPMDENAARDLLFDLLGTNSADVVPFGTEAGLFQQMGMAAIVCGPGSIQQAHKPDEFVSLEQLQACHGMLDRLVQTVTV
ncbi:acetylornithine deacetylase [Pontibaca salina]|uniref:Acetylornithine deacetylase n=1 Tax=Pontibaca salina TaxID=2795731 RepID=A0A934LZA3_9RHOB|nr:acetylornithine deacetylase [Pontibaca salina]MBI6630687.1 acetylornithine deacetylase [Pontibaca salina]